jgi:Dipeptidyl peptidase IV (DPP IV) N-terminal region
MQKKELGAIWITIAILIGVCLPITAVAQGTEADYVRAAGLQAKYEAAAIDIAGPASWLGQSHKFFYRKTSRGTSEFIMVDAETLKKEPAFDHEKIAESLSKLTGKTYKAQDLPLGRIRFDDTGANFFALVDTTPVRCTVKTSSCTKVEPGALGGFGGGGGGFGRRGRQEGPRVSPDKKWEASINNFNVAIRPAGTTEVIHLSTDGSEGNYYTLNSIEWSPDSKKLAAYRVRPGYHREVHYVESSPEDQLQPKFSSRVYAKPGDVLDLKRPVLFDIASKKQFNVDTTLFPNPYDTSRIEWWKDSRAFTFEYNQRGHQVYRVIEVDAATGKARAIISEEPKTFFNYTRATGNLTGSGKNYRHNVDDGKEIIWMSERDGWNHLYLYDEGMRAKTLISSFTTASILTARG